jgi:hypothetical protein
LSNYADKVTAEQDRALKQVKNDGADVDSPYRC